MEKYYTRACNFYYGQTSRDLLKKRQSIPFSSKKDISFDRIEIISRKSKKIIHINDIKNQNSFIKKKILFDLKNIKKKRIIKKLDICETPVLMGVLNLTPDSFSDGGKFNKKIRSFLQAKKLINDGCRILDIGGESTRPGSKTINENVEWKRIKFLLSKSKKLKTFISIDTRKSLIMKNALKYGFNLLNDVSGLNYDKSTISFLKKTKIAFVIHHSQGSPEFMQLKPSYKNVVLDIYDYFENKIEELRLKGINHNNIILDPGIGFGKNLKHNITLLNNISIFHSLGFPVMLGTSRKKFIKDLSGNNDSTERLGGTIASSLFAVMQGVQILRVHDVNEVRQSIKVFNALRS